MNNNSIPSSEVLAKMALQCVQDSREWFPEIALSIPHHTLSMAGELGEFANIVKKIERGSLEADKAVVKHELAMELTDVFIYLLNIAGLLQVDLEKSYAVKRAENVKRFGKDNK